MADKELKDMTIEELKDLEEMLYDMEVSGVNCWFERDKVIWELQKRDV